MTQMVRKQIYIQKRQNALLKRLAKARGVSEAEIVRQAIDRQAGAETAKAFRSDPGAWDDLYKSMLARRELGVQGEPYRWRREDLYEERLNRLAPRAN